MRIYHRHLYIISIQSDAIVYRNGNNGHSMHKSDSLEEDLQRAISTAERRKVRKLQFKTPAIHTNFPLINLFINRS